MKKEISKIIEQEYDEALEDAQGHDSTFRDWIAYATEKLAALFEREMAEREGRLLWEGEARWDMSEQDIGRGYIALVLRPGVDLPDGKRLIFSLASQQLDDRDGQRVKVKVEELPEKQPEIEKAQEDSH